MKQFFRQNQNLILSAIMLGLLFGFVNLALADTPGNVIRSVGEQTALPSYDAGHASQSYQAGASQITSIIFYLTDFLTYVLGAIATLMIIVSGFKLIVSMRTVAEAQTKEKETLRLAFIGLFLVIIANQLVKNVLFGEEGEVFRSGTDLQQASQRGADLALGLTNMIRVAIPVVAVLFMVVAGVRLVTAMGDPAKFAKAKKAMAWTLIGVVLAGLADIIIFTVVFPAQGGMVSMTPAAFGALVVKMTNFISGFLSIISVVMIIYSGYLYVISRGGDLIGKAKKALTGAIVGLLIAMAAYGLVNTFIKVEPLIEQPPEQQAPSQGNP